MHSQGGNPHNQDLSGGRAAQGLAGEGTDLDCHLKPGPLYAQESVKTAGPLSVSFELLSTSLQTQRKGCTYL